MISNRRRRQARFITRAWQIRNGQFSTKNSTIDKSEWFSAINKHYVGTYLKPQQRSILSAHLPKSSAETITIKFKLWEAAKNLQLKVCCGNRKTCVFETEIGLKRGTRKWLSRQATCPGGTELVSIIFLSTISPFRCFLSAQITATIKEYVVLIALSWLEKSARQLNSNF